MNQIVHRRRPHCCVDVLLEAPGYPLKNRSVATISNNTLDYQTFLQQRGKISKLPGVFLSSFSRCQMSAIKESFLCSLKSHHNGDYATSTSPIFINKNNVLMSQSSFALCRKYYVTGISSTTPRTRLIHYDENSSILNHLKVFVFPFYSLFHIHILCHPHGELC